MPFGRNGHYTMRGERSCAKCRRTTDQMAVSVRYSIWPEPTVPASYAKRIEWICESCENLEEEVKQIFEPTDHLRIIKRLLTISEDYDFLKMKISSHPDEIVVRIRVPDFDPSTMRAIQQKQRQTGFVSADELMQLQRAGFRRPSDVPPKPQPKDRSVLRERARQRMFAGEPRSI